MKLPDVGADDIKVGGDENAEDMKLPDTKSRYKLEDQVLRKMFRENKQFNTRIIQNKKKDSINGCCKKTRYPPSGYD